jgi:O-antigen/teichoic acid export membrane protein
MKLILWSLSNTFLYSGISAIFIILLGNLLLPHELGIYVTIIMVVTYAVSLMSLEIGSGVAQKLNVSDLSDRRSHYFSAGWFSILLISFFVVSIMYLAKDLLLNIFNLEGESSLLLVAFPLVFLKMNREYFSRVLQADLKIKTLTIINSLSVVLQLACALLFISMGYGIYGVIVAVYIGDVVAVAGTGYINIKTHGIVIESATYDAAKKCIRFSLLIYLGTIAVFLDKNIDLFFVNHFLPKSQLAIYNYALMAAFLLLLFGYSISYVTFPMLTKTFSAGILEEAQRIYSFSLNFSFFILSVVALFLAFHAEYFVDLLLPPMYKGVVAPLNILLPGLVLFSSVATVGSIFTAKGVPGYGAFTVWLALGMNIVLCLILIPRYGIVGSALATSVSFASRALLTIVLVEWKIKVDYKVSGILCSFILLTICMYLGKTLLNSLLLSEMVIVMFGTVNVFLLLRREEKEHLKKLFQGLKAGWNHGA